MSTQRSVRLQVARVQELFMYVPSILVLVFMVF